MQRYDVLIVGGGPAGSSCAWRLVQAGVKCLVLDKASFPRNKPCAGWITPEVVREIDLENSGYPYGFSTFPRLHIRVRGFPIVHPSTQHAIRRVEFDDWMLKRSGAPFEHHRVKVIDVTDGGYIVDGEFFGKSIVGAGGTHCPVYHALFKPESPRADSNRIVAREEEFAYAWEDDRCQLWFLENNLPGYSWYVPKANGYVNVGVGGVVEEIQARGDSINTHWEHLIRKLDQKGLIRGHDYQPVSHVYHLHRSLPEIQRDGAFLVGDAAGLATVDMGEGIGPAIQSGLRAAEAIISGGEYSVNSISRYSLVPRILRGLLPG